MSEKIETEVGTFGIKKTGAKAVRTSRLGVYVYKRFNGKTLGDTEGNILAIDSYYGDEVRKAILVKTAHAILFREGLDIAGEAEFLDGQHTCSDEDYIEQIYEFKENGIL